MNKASGSANYIFLKIQMKMSVVYFNLNARFYSIKNMGGIPGSLLNDNTYLDKKT
jgi:hypothetical protein